MREIAAPNAALLTITRLDPVKLTIYVPETQIGQIKLAEFGAREDRSNKGDSEFGLDTTWYVDLRKWPLGVILALTAY